MNPHESSGVDETILSYLLHRAAREEGSVGRVAKEAGSHAFVHARHLGQDAAKAQSDAVNQRVRDLLAFPGDRTARASL